MEHVLQEREHFVGLPVPNVEGWSLQVVDGVLSEHIFVVVWNFSPQELFLNLINALHQSTSATAKDHINDRYHYHGRIIIAAPYIIAQHIL